MNSLKIAQLFLLLLVVVSVIQAGEGRNEQRQQRQPDCYPKIRVVRSEEKKDQLGCVQLCKEQFGEKWNLVVPKTSAEYLCVIQQLEGGNSTLIWTNIAVSPGQPKHLFDRNSKLRVGSFGIDNNVTLVYLASSNTSENCIYFHNGHYVETKCSRQFRVSCACAKVPTPPPCTKHCYHHGKCIRENNKMTCKCHPQWLGDQCQGPFCYRQCQNGGKCNVNESVLSWCECPPFVYGDNCEIKCNKTCQNGGTCVGPVGNFTCRCPNHFSGDLCQTFCNKKCENGGTCVGSACGMTCACPYEFHGDTCEKRKCSKECQNGGTCLRGGNDMMCVCRPGFTGETCEKCSKCMNGGACHFDGTSVGCKCKEDFTGPKCEMHFCNMSCENDGVCMHLAGTPAKCICREPFSGDRCEITAEEECTKECQNGGTCYKAADFIGCYCRSGFEGPSCQFNQASVAPTEFDTTSLIPANRKRRSPNSENLNLFDDTELHLGNLGQ